MEEIERLLLLARHRQALADYVHHHADRQKLLSMAASFVQEARRLSAATGAAARQHGHAEHPPPGRQPADASTG